MRGQAGMAPRRRAQPRAAVRGRPSTAYKRTDNTKSWRKLISGSAAAWRREQQQGRQIYAAERIRRQAARAPSEIHAGQGGAQGDGKAGRGVATALRIFPRHHVMKGTEMMPPPAPTRPANR